MHGSLCAEVQNRKWIEKKRKLPSLIRLSVAATPLITHAEQKKPLN